MWLDSAWRTMLDVWSRCDSIERRLFERWWRRNDECWTPSRSVIWQAVKYKSESSVNFAVYMWSCVTRELMIRTFLSVSFFDPSSTIVLLFHTRCPSRQRNSYFLHFFNLLNKFEKKNYTFLWILRASNFSSISKSFCNSQDTSRVFKRSQKSSSQYNRWSYKNK